MAATADDDELMPDVVMQDAAEAAMQNDSRLREHSNSREPSREASGSGTVARSARHVKAECNAPATRRKIQRQWVLPEDAYCGTCLATERQISQCDTCNSWTCEDCINMLVRCKLCPNCPRYTQG